MLPATRRVLRGPPLALPAPLDRCAEAWWRAAPRVRLLLGATALLTVFALGLGHAASTPYGPPVPVHVATRDLHAGDTLGDGDVRQVLWPRDLVPAGAGAAPTGVLRSAVPEGAAVTDRHLGAGGPAAALPAGRVAVAVPVEVLPALDGGTSVDLVGVGPDGVAGTLAPGAVVLHSDGIDVWVAVDEADAVAVSAATASGAIAAVVRPP